MLCADRLRPPAGCAGQHCCRLRHGRREHASPLTLHRQLLLQHQPLALKLQRHLLHCT